MYKFIADDVSVVHNKCLKWKEELRNNYDNSLKEFGEEHIRLYKLTNVAKYRSFQYRLLQQRGLVTNRQLLKWNITQNADCSFCRLHTETVLHMLWKC